MLNNVHVHIFIAHDTHMVAVALSKKDSYSDLCNVSLIINGGCCLQLVPALEDGSSATPNKEHQSVS